MNRVELGFHWDFASMVAAFIFVIVVLAFFLGC